MSVSNQKIKHAGQWILVAIIIIAGILYSFLFTCPSVSSSIFILFGAAALIVAPTSEKILSSVHPVAGKSVFRILLSIIMVAAGILIIHSHCEEFRYSGYHTQVKNYISENFSTELAANKKSPEIYEGSEDSRTSNTDSIENGNFKDGAADKGRDSNAYQRGRKKTGGRADSKGSYKNKRSDNKEGSFREIDKAKNVDGNDSNKKATGAGRANYNSKKHGSEPGIRKEAGQRSKHTQNSSKKYVNTNQKKDHPNRKNGSDKGHDVHKKNRSLKDKIALSGDIAEWSYDKQTGGTGRLEKKLRDGKIIYLSKNGDTYRGEVKNGKRNGYGVYSYSHGAVYKGFWKDNMAYGQGTIIWPNGDRYTGGWVWNKRSGRGTYFWKKGDRYTGMWEKDKKNGKGTYRWKRGDVYIGEWYMNFRHGKGLYIWPSGKKYKGKWVMDVRQ